jgi:hypothetical protein
MKIDETKIVKIRTTPAELRALADKMEAQYFKAKLGDSTLVDVVTTDTQLQIQFHHPPFKEIDQELAAKFIDRYKECK